jgi:hypothetical protein
VQWFRKPEASGQIHGRIPLAKEHDLLPGIDLAFREDAANALRPNGQIRVVKANDQKARGL